MKNYCIFKQYAYNNNKLDSAFECKLAEPLDCTGGTLGFRGTLVENHCSKDYALDFIKTDLNFFFFFDNRT